MRPESPVWSAFVRVEADVATSEQAITQEEDQISGLASRIQDGPGSATQGGSLREWHRRSGSLVSLLRRHQQAVGDYQTSLQDEYQFFVRVAQDSTLRVALMGATAAAPAATSVVAYDLDAVTSQLRQERAIAAAESTASEQAQQQLRLFALAPRFMAPVGGVVSQGFGSTTLAMEPSLSYHGVFYEHFHTGIDIANLLDTPVGAAAAGRVIFAGSNRDATGKLVGYGNYVVIDHGGGYITLYGHLDQVAVATGQLVQRGQEIGLLGTTGWSTGPHLHFEIRRNGDFVDPEALLGDAVRP